MLELINAERTRAGLNPVALGDNAAAQLHAEAALEHCFSSHWGVDGLKPYMRYSLAGGHQSNGENMSGLNYCIRASDRYRAIAYIPLEIRETMDGLMSSPGHRDNILRPWHKAVNIGLAWDLYNFKVVQHFEGGYVEYEQLPVIENGILTMAGTAKNGVVLSGDQDLGVQLYYDPPPHPLTQGQVSRTYCYSQGLEIASLRPPLSGGWFYDEDEYTTTYKRCPNPYAVPANSPAPRSPDEANVFHQAAYDSSQAGVEMTVTVPWITASAWSATGVTFSVAAHVGSLLDVHGNGVYTVVVWGWLPEAGTSIVISEYSIFHGVTSPDTYGHDPGP